VEGWKKGLGGERAMARRIENYVFLRIVWSFESRNQPLLQRRTTFWRLPSITFG
jgi:hypothetical protein